MEWLTKSASLVAKSQFTLPDGTSMTLPVRWTTPLGFPVLQRYYKTSANRVKTRINGSIIYLTMSEETKQVDSRKSAQGMSPNWVHSCDAAHLQLSVARAWEEGMEHFSLIHDSFGTHACNAGHFASVIKEAMLEMYSTSDVVADLFWELLSQVPEDKVGDLELPPSKGTLDLEAVLASEYSFA
jgi:DNA-directed RNA polymerase